MAFADLGLSGVDADHGVAVVGVRFAEPADRRDGCSGAAFDDDQAPWLDFFVPIVESPVLKRCHGVVPIPIAEHENVGSGRFSALGAMR